MPETSLIDTLPSRIMPADTVLSGMLVTFGFICACIVGLAIGVGLLAAVCFVRLSMTLVYSRPRTAKPT